MVLDEALMSLASLVGQSVVAAAATDAWEMAKRGFARLLGRDDPQRAELMEQRLERARQQLAGVSGAELEQVRNRVEAAWQARVQDVLEEYPELAAGLWALVSQIRAVLPAGLVAAAGHGVAAGRDVIIAASGGAVAAGTVHGSVTPGNPTGPGSAHQ
jgi:hypothetical protein